MAGQVQWEKHGKIWEHPLYIEVLTSYTPPMSSGFFPATFEKALSASSFRQVRGTIRLHLTWFDCPKEGYKHLLAMMSWIFGIFLEVLSTPGFFCDGVSKPFGSMFQTFMCSKDSLDFSRCNPKTDQNWPKPQNLRASECHSSETSIHWVHWVPFHFRSHQISAPEWRLFPRSPPPVVSDLHSPWPTPTPMDSDGLKELLGLGSIHMVLLRILQFWGNVVRWRNSLGFCYS